MDVVKYSLTMYNDMLYRDCQPLQIPEKAESLRGIHWLFVRCWECRNLFSEEQTVIGFRTHGSWYDDGPFSASFCLACNYRLWAGMPRWLFVE